MARKLLPDEKRHFALALQNPELLADSDESFHETMDAKRDVALRLSPELQAWFGKEFLPWSKS